MKVNRCPNAASQDGAVCTAPVAPPSGHRVAPLTVLLREQNLWWRITMTMPARIFICICVSFRRGDQMLRGAVQRAIHLLGHVFTC